MELAVSAKPPLTVPLNEMAPLPAFKATFAASVTAPVSDMFPFVVAVEMSLASEIVADPMSTSPGSEALMPPSSEAFSTFALTWSGAASELPVSTWNVWPDLEALSATVITVTSAILNCFATSPVPDTVYFVPSLEISARTSAESL